MIQQRKEYNQMNLTELLDEITKRFNSRGQKYDTVCFSLTRWVDGYWSIEVIDDWHKWIDKNISKLNNKYFLPETACKEFLNHCDKHKINLKKLQSK